MADQFDRASDEEAMATQAAIALQRILAAKAARLAPIGECLNPACGELFEHDMRLFCNSDCEREHRRRNT